MSIVTMSFFDHCNNEKQIIVNLQKGSVVARNANRQCIALTDFAFRLNVDNTTAKKYRSRYSVGSCSRCEG